MRVYIYISLMIACAFVFESLSRSNASKGPEHVEELRRRNMDVWGTSLLPHETQRMATLDA